VSLDPIALAESHWRDHGWADAAPGMRAVTTITRVQQLLHRRIDEALRPDLTFARYEILMLLVFSRRGALPMSVIGSRLQVHAASVTSAVDRLERDGYVVRERGETDRRLVLARITPSGRRRALAATEVLNAEVFDELGMAERDTRDLSTRLDRVRARLGDPVAGD
jgi:DNA-binding MarR family transcriptional regulator